MDVGVYVVPRGGTRHIAGVVDTTFGHNRYKRVAERITHPLGRTEAKQGIEARFVGKDAVAMDFMCSDRH